jgi:hypothetical protein
VSLEMAKWKNDEMAKIKPAGILPFRPFRHFAIPPFPPLILTPPPLRAHAAVT